MTDPLAEVLTLEEAAELAGVSSDAMLKAARRGAIRARRVGPPLRGLWITTEEEAVRYRVERRRPGPEPG